MHPSLASCLGIAYPSSIPSYYKHCNYFFVLSSTACLLKGCSNKNPHLRILPPWVVIKPLIYFASAACLENLKLFKTRLCRFRGVQSILPLQSQCKKIAKPSRAKKVVGLNGCSCSRQKHSQVSSTLHWGPQVPGKGLGFLGPSGFAFPWENLPFTAEPDGNQVYQGSLFVLIQW